MKRGIGKTLMHQSTRFPQGEPLALPLNNMRIRQLQSITVCSAGLILSVLAFSVTGRDT